MFKKSVIFLLLCSIMTAGGGDMLLGESETGELKGFGEVEKVYTDPVSGKETPIYYHFASHLPEMKAMISDGKGKILETAEWQGNYFEFPQFGSKHRMALQKALFDGKEQEGIFVLAVKESSKILKFYKLPPKGKVILFYGVADENVPEKVRQHVYLKLWVGQKLIKRIRIPVEKGWKMREIPLGVVPFLMEPVAISFEISSDTTEGQFFFFDAHLA